MKFNTKYVFTSRSKRQRNAMVMCAMFCLGSFAFMVQRPGDSVLSLSEGAHYSFIELWRDMYTASQNITQDMVKFKAVMNDTEVQITMDILERFARTMEEHNLTYFMYGGTLIGSLRHHGPIPWDDDIDVIIDMRQREEVWRHLNALHPAYVISEVKGQKFWKFYSARSARIKPQLSWHWPFVDLWMYTVKDSEQSIVDWSCEWCKPVASYPQNIIFPLKKRPFGSLMLYAPNDPISFLNTFYTWEYRCDSRMWNHRNEKVFDNEIQKVPCQTLSNYYALVERKFTSNDTVTENLIYKNQHIKKFVDKLG